MSVQESIYHKVPMLVLPLFADQMANGHRAERQGYGKVLYINGTTTFGDSILFILWNCYWYLTDGDGSTFEANLLGNITELMFNSSYTRKVEELSKIVRDEMTTPLEKAVFWTEYVMRHRGARHLRSPGHKVTFLQFHNVDVILLMAVIFSVFVGLMTCCIWKIFSRIAFRKA